MTLHLARAPATPDELWWTIKALWGVELPRVSVCAEHVSPFEAVSHAFFGTAPNYAVWYASRGSGKSLALAVLGLTKAFVRDVDVTILGGSMTQSLNVREHMRKLMAHKNAPLYAVEKDQATLIQMSTGRGIKPLPASQTTVRGPHPPLQLLDEVDEMDWDIYDASMGQAMEQLNAHGELIEEYIVASSTWQNPEGTFTRVIENAREKGMPVFTWCVSTGSYISKADGTKEQIQRLRPGDLVSTRQGPKPVQHVTCTGVRPTVKVTLSDGKSLVCTRDHKIATDRGWVEASALTTRSRVLVDAGPAASLAITSDDQVVPAVGVPVRTVGSSELGLDVRHPTAVLGDGARDEMIGVDARRVVADHVVQAGSGVDVGMQQSPDRAVGQLLTEADVACDVPVAAVAVGAFPLPAPHRGDDGGALYVGQVEGDLGCELRPGDGLLDTAPAVAGGGVLHGYVAAQAVHVVSVTAGADAETWDIGVEDAHEFVAESVIVHNCWRELLQPNGWMSQRFIDNKRNAVSAQMWHTEYELNEPTAGSRAVDLDKVEAHFVDYPAPLRETHIGNGDHDVYTWEDPAVGGMYSMGADWAKEQDKTVIVVLRTDVRPRRVVKLTRINRRPWPMMIKLFNDDITTYHANAYHDGTGIGNVVGDFVEHSDTLRKFVMIGRPRTQLLLDYITDFEHGIYKLPRIGASVEHKGVLVNPLYRSHRAVTVADVYAPGKWNSHLPDDFAAMSLAHRAAELLPQPVHEGFEVKKDGVARKVDAPFAATPGGTNERVDGGVTVVDERYDPSSDLVVASAETMAGGIW